MLDTRPMLLLSDFPQIRRAELHTLQVNLGYKCNLSCTHCHVAAGPNRTEMMDRKTVDMLLQFIDAQNIKVLDLTGGAPEMNPEFRYLVTQARKRDVKVIDRCNLTVLLEPDYEDMAQFLADNQVEIVASLPCYSEENVDKQRGKGVYDGSIEALQRLNQLGYGIEGSGLLLNLVYNPGGAFLPPPQQQLELDYKRELFDRFSIEFNELFSITNMPISRFGSVLLSKGEFNNYMGLLKGAYSEQNLESVMCRNLISIDWQGYVYDCDFNQMLEMPLVQPNNHIASDRTHIADLIEQNIEGHPIVVANHCYGCTAGQGSSCGGALE
ncbi:arsenosugar biosynthesis radical SAM (seleno)protein ArsS [Alkalimarinus sediminis]|uniref:Arsenosugar biosynthesis radical SAM protein ArsS n=1 Tax=Alkalimarinus sediminis TaxID=1632866 RepID=A0A9E8HLY1_9ALTE|nr:arsenosugar biosynthesis radical SAM (seleno)protein ArsS [Alkalimarinus sediminis]UZW75777.1 arsenosugar biosynthesis radical SAM protein ArsS [Alkalimarinus sediminis]